MGARTSVMLAKGRTEIDDPQLEANLALLAERWGMGVEEALHRALTMALARHKLRRRSKQAKT